MKWWSAGARLYETSIESTIMNYFIQEGKVTPSSSFSASYTPDCIHTTVSIKCLANIYRTHQYTIFMQKNVTEGDAQENQRSTNYLCSNGIHRTYLPWCNQGRKREGWVRRCQFTIDTTGSAKPAELREPQGKKLKEPDFTLVHTCI